MQVAGEDAEQREETRQMELGSSRRPEQALAVVVGAGAMGMAIARRLGATYRLLLADRDEAHLERQVAALCSEGHDARGAVCDVIDAAAVGRLAAAARDAGPLRALAHVVGLSPSMAGAEQILQVNLIGPTLVAGAFLELAQPGMTALFVASVAGHQPRMSPETAAALAQPLAPEFVDLLEKAVHGPVTPVLAYQLSKAAVITMCQKGARAWAERGARIVSLSPGPIATPQGALERDRQPEKVRLLEHMPLRREGTLIEVADAAEFLLSDRASYITGSDLLVDGGASAILRQGW